MAKRQLRALGYARVFKDEDGELVVDKTTLRRRSEVSGDDDLGDEDVGDEDTDDDDDDDDDLGEDEDLGDEDDLGDEEVGGRRSKRRKARRKTRRVKRRSNRQERREDRRGGDEVKWGKTALSGESNTPDDVGDQITITIRPQHWFKAQDITFTGDTSAKIDTIFLGERPVWNNSSGVPVSVFSSTGMLRGLLAGQKIRPGLDIVIKGTAGTASTTTTATVIGYKPLNTSC